MGLQTLNEKIKNWFKQENYSEEDVLYLLVEMGKYLERSGKNLGDPVEIKRLYENDFHTIKFFRNWVAHPNIDRYVPRYVLDVIEKGISNKDNQEVEKTLFILLKDEIARFCETIRPDINIDKMNWDRFFYSLKHILTEQSVDISHNGKIYSLCYDKSLTLRRI